MIRWRREVDWVEFRMRRPVVAALEFGAIVAFGTYVGSVVLTSSWRGWGPLFIAEVFVVWTLLQVWANRQLARDAGKR